MQTKIFIPIFLVFVITFTASAQEISKKEAKEKQKTAKENQVKALINSGSFVFVADRAMPQGGRTVDLISYQAYVKFQPDLIDYKILETGTKNQESRERMVRKSYP